MSICTFNNFFSEGKRQGLSEEFRVDGTLKRRQYFKNNELHGLLEIFKKDGTLKKSILYVDGEVSN